MPESIAGLPGEQRHRSGGSTVVLQGTEARVGIIEVTDTIETASAVAAQVVAVGLNATAAVPSSIVRENAVLHGHGVSVDVENATASAFRGRILAECAVVDREGSRGLE